MLEDMLELDAFDIGLASYMKEIREEKESMKEFSGCSSIMKGIAPHYSKQLYFNFEGEKDAN